MATVSLKNVKKKFGSTEVIQGISTDIKDGEFIVIVGPSGCGKSTLLRMIAGLETVTEGEIFIDEDFVNEKEPMDRDIAMVFQNYALYPHMSVRQNMGYGLKIAKMPKDQIDAKVVAAAKLLQLEPLLDRRPKQLSGGQRQRVAMGRAIVREPAVFLFDEPLSNLDAELRVEMRVEISRLHRELGTTIIYVTHDQVEAMTLADKIVVLKDGLIQQVGSPLSLYDDPENVFVAGFIGSPTINFVQGRVNGAKIIVPSLESLKLNAPKDIDSNQSELLIGLRPQHIQISGSGDLEVEFTEALGDVSYLYLKTPNGERIVVESRDDKLPKTAAKVGIKVDTSRALLFDPKTELRVR